MEETLQDKITKLLEDAAAKAIDPTGGVTRLLYSKEWVDTQYALKEQMEALGLQTYFDEVGNLYGRLAGSGDKDETILTGSHVDTVKNGGKYDGMYGITAGIMALHYLKETYGSPLKNIEVVSFAEEEGSRFPEVYWGSKNFLGLGKQEEVALVTDHEGITFQDAMRGAGFDFCSPEKKVREDVSIFLEAHIEQGNVLEKEKKTIGIVNSIAGQRRYIIKLHGTANHAGTTPMEYRQDAFYAAAKMTVAILGRAKEYGSPLVATTGYVDVKPNVGNVVPGETEFSLDVRHTDGAFLESFSEEIQGFIKEIADECGVVAEVDMWMNELPVPMDGKLVSCLEDVCKKQSLDYKLMHSGAGHDSQLIGRHIPTAMLFVPSRNGISHNPEEYTAPEYLEKGTYALADAIYQLAYQE